MAQTCPPGSCRGSDIGATHRCGDVLFSSEIHSGATQYLLQLVAGFSTAFGVLQFEEKQQRTERERVWAIGDEMESTVLHMWTGDTSSQTHANCHTLHVVV